MQDGTTKLGAITDPHQVMRLVMLVLAAHVDQTIQEQTSACYYVAFHLADRTAVIRACWLTSGELERDVLLPPTFATAMQQATQT